VSSATTILDPALSNLVFALLQPHGFGQNENRFVKNLDDTTWLITLQKSCCSSVHNLNLAVVVNQLLNRSAGAEETRWGHLQTRLCLLAESDLMLALDTMEPMAYTERQRIIAAALADFGLPWLEQFGSLDSIRQAIKSGALNPKHHPLGGEDFATLLG